MWPDPERLRRRGRVVALILGSAWATAPGPLAGSRPRAGDEPATLLREAGQTNDRALRRRLARQALRALAGARPGRPWLEARAWALFGEPDRGLEFLRGAPVRAEDELERVETVRTLAEALLELGSVEAAGEALSFAPPELPELKGLRARVLARQGLELLVGPRKGEALPLLLQALEAGARDPELVRTLFDAFRDLDRHGEIQQALAGFRALARALPEETWTIHNLAVALRRDGRYEEADQALAAGASRHPRDPDFPGERGLLEKARGRQGRAEAQLRKAATLADQGAGTMSSARANLGLLLLDRGQPGQARDVLAPLLAHPDPGPLPALLWLRITLGPERPAL